MTIGNLSDAADTLLLQRLLDQAAAAMIRKKPAELDAANAGTVLRFLTAWLAIQPGRWVLTGSDRMKQRPVGILADALNQLGASIDYLAKPGYPPLLIRGGALNGYEVSVDAGTSSQFTTALLLIAPCLPGGLMLRLKGTRVSSSYTQMTIRLMRHHGADVRSGKSWIRVMPVPYKPLDHVVEPDWSAAAFWYEAAVLADEVDLVLTGFTAESLQGDAILPGLFSNFGIVTEFRPDGIRLTRQPNRIDGFYFNFLDCPDIVQAVVATCAGLGIRGRFEGVQSLRIKETDRLLAMKNELEKLGMQVTFQSERGTVSVLEFRPGKLHYPEGLAFDSYGDHRTAMSLAPLALRAGSLRITNPDVVEKSYPSFWQHLEQVGFVIQ